MTQITVNLKHGADAEFIRRIIESLKGVMQAKISREPISSKSTEDMKMETTTKIAKLAKIRKSIDRASIDLSDERTNYLMSK